MAGLPVPNDLIPYLTKQLIDDSNVSASILRANVVFIILVPIVVGLRIYVRFFMLRAAGADDYLLILAAVSALVLSSTCLVGLQAGFGVHLWNLSDNLQDLPHMASRITQLLFVCYLAYSTAITFVKCSVIAGYLRLFPIPAFRRLMYGTGAIVLIFWVCSIFCIVFTCIPVRALWDFTILNPRCFPILNFFYVAAGFNIATDLTLCLAPLPVLWTLQLPRPQKIVVCVLFSFGLFACAASIIRLTQLPQLNSADVSYGTTSSLNWSVAEVGTAIVCACVSVMRPLASMCFPRLFSKLGTGGVSRRTAYAGSTASGLRSNQTIGPSRGRSMQRHQEVANPQKMAEEDIEFTGVSSRGGISKKSEFSVFTESARDSTDQEHLIVPQPPHSDRTEKPR